MSCHRKTAPASYLPKKTRTEKEESKYKKLRRDKKFWNSNDPMDTAFRISASVL
jgi:hypothetical protein